MIKKDLYIALIAFILVSISSCMTDKTVQLAQKDIDRVNLMPDFPLPYKMLNWKEKAITFDKVIFDLDVEGDYQPFIWIDTNHRNIDQETFGIYTVIGDVRQGRDVNKGEFHEAINSFGALLSAGLMGIDKSQQDGYNYVKMAQNYFNTDTQWDIMMNNTCPEVALLGGGYGRDWWYDVYPNLLYYGLCDLFPDIENAENIQRRIADQFYLADSVLDGNYSYSYFDYAAMEGKNNHIPPQEDAAAGHAWVLLSAYQKFQDSKYLNASKSAIEALLSQKESRYYEVLMPFGALTAARLNAEYDAEYDVHKILDWTFEGCSAERGRTGWGVIEGNWNGYDMSGLQGSRSDGGGYAFLMNTFDLAWPLVAMVRYAPEYSHTVGKWMLNAANATRFFYPYEMPDSNQYLPEKKSITRNVIGYEGIRKTDPYNKEGRLKGVSPVALGDGPNWVVNQPDVSMFSIYGSAHVGIFGSIISTTNVEGILQLNCLATDFYREPAYPTFIYYNPWDEEKSVEYINTDNEVDLYDVLTDQIIAKNVPENVSFDIPAKGTRLLVAVPAGSRIIKKDGKSFANGIVIKY